MAKLPLTQSTLMEKDENVVEVFPIDQARWQVRSALLFISLVCAALVLSILAFGIQTPLWGNLLGVSISVTAMTLLRKAGFLPRLWTHNQ